MHAPADLELNCVLNVSTGHKVQIVADSDENLPAGHTAQPTRPVASEYFPAGHVAQLPAWLPTWYCPDGQPTGRHGGVLLEPKYFPSGQHCTPHASAAAETGQSKVFSFIEHPSEPGSVPTRRFPTSPELPTLEPAHSCGTVPDIMLLFTDIAGNRVTPYSGGRVPDNRFLLRKTDSTRGICDHSPGSDPVIAFRSRLMNRIAFI